MINTRPLAVAATTCGAITALAASGFVATIIMGLDPSELGIFLILGLGMLSYFGMVMFLALYVYHDAESRGMKGWIWALLILLFASLPGFLVYLLIRSPKLVCPSCGSRVDSDFVVCPSCRVSLGLTCPSCRRRVRSNWVVCPYCQENLEASAETRSSSSIS